MENKDYKHLYNKYKNKYKNLIQKGGDYEVLPGQYNENNDIFKKKIDFTQTIYNYNNPNNIKNFTEQNTIDDIIDNTDGKANFQIVNFFVSKDYIENPKKMDLKLIKTNGTYFSIWIKCNDDNRENGEVILGTGGYPQDKLHLPDTEPKISITDINKMKNDNIDELEKKQIQDKIDKWFKHNKKKETIPAIIESMYISDRKAESSVTLEKFITLCNIYGIKYNNSHSINHIKQNDMDIEKLHELNRFFAIIKSIIYCKTFDEIKEFIDKKLGMFFNNIEEDVIITDYTTKYTGKTWIKGHFRLELIIRDRIYKLPAIIKLPPSDVIAIIR